MENDKKRLEYRPGDTFSVFINPFTGNYELAEEFEGDFSELPQNTCVFIVVLIKKDKELPNPIEGRIVICKEKKSSNALIKEYSTKEDNVEYKRHNNPYEADYEYVHGDKGAVLFRLGDVIDMFKFGKWFVTFPNYELRLLKPVYPESADQFCRDNNFFLIGKY